MNQNANEADAGWRPPTAQTSPEEQQLAILRRLVKAGFDELDLGAGLSLGNESELSSAIARIGRRASKRTSQP